MGVQASVSPPGASTTGGIYALASSGVLILMRAAGRTIDKSVNLQVSRGGPWGKESQRRGGLPEGGMEPTIGGTAPATNPQTYGYVRIGTWEAPSHAIHGRGLRCLSQSK